MHEMMQGLYKAHYSCVAYANSMNKFPEPTYVEEFKASRTKTFCEFMASLTAANRGALVNNFNMHFMSLPLEHSLRNNFWFAYALSA